jgi:salicylate hydroxylase
MKNQVFHIAGGGIAGLASALAVAGAGGSAIVMEKAPRFEATGAGLQLGPNAVRALQRLGAWDAVEPFTFAPPEIHIRDGASGKNLTRIELGKKFEQRFGQPYRVAHRADLHQALLTVTGSKSAIIINTNAEVIARDTFDGFALIAADGVWSKTRDALFPGHAAITTQDTIFRGMLQNIPTDCVTLWLYPGGHVVHYPVGNPTKLNLVAVTQGEDVQTHFKNACDELRGLLAQTAEWSKWPAAYVPPLQQWNKENVILIGDAAHGTLPYLAQGAAMALEDAASLGEVLARQKDAKVAFQELNNMRIRRTSKLHRSTIQVGKVYHCAGFPAKARSAILSAIPAQIQLSRLKWIYNWTQ